MKDSLMQPLAQTPWHATVLTLFPEMFPGPLGYSLSGKALQKELWRLDTLQIRNFAYDRHHTVDDTPYGGGAGMVLKAEVLQEALQSACNKTTDRRLIYLTPRGVPLTQLLVRELALNTSGVILLCGRYEGIDQRILETWPFQEISLGDYVLSGGEMAALTLMDACVRLLPQVVGKQESLENESFELGLLEYPQYTKPQTWNNKIVPDELLSGDHQKIALWRQLQAERITQERRPDLWEAYLKNKER